MTLPNDRGAAVPVVRPGGEEGERRTPSLPWNAVREGSAVGALYLLLAVAYTWPLVLHLRDSVLGYTGFENTPQTLWLYEQWKAYTLVGVRDLLQGHLLDPSHLSAFLWSQSCYAIRVSMANGIDFVPTLLLDTCFGFPAYYNVKCLLVLATNALGGYALTRVLTGSRVAGFFAGAVFAFNPFVFYELATGRMVESILFPLPLYVLCLVRAWQGEQGARWAAGAGACLGVAGLIYWFNCHFLFAFTLVFLVCMGVTTGLRGYGRRFLPLLLVPVVALTLVMPAALPYMVKLARGDRIPGSVRSDGPDEAHAFTHQLVSWSCDAEYPFRGPSPQHSHSPPWELPGMMGFNVTLTLVALVTLGLVPRGRRYWIVLFVAMYTLPLGPYLCAGGSVVKWGGQPVPMPYFWLVTRLPFLDRLFFPNQTMVMWVLVTAAVVGFGLAAVVERFPRVGMVLGCLVLAVSAGEMHAARILPVASSPVSVPAVYVQARTEPTDGFIYLPVNLKFWERAGRSDREFYNGTDLTHVDYHMAMNGRKSLWGRNQYLAGDSYWMFEPRTMFANSFLGFLVDVDRSEKPYEESDRQQVSDQGFHYVVAMERLCSHPPARGGYTTRLEEGSALYALVCQRLEKHLGPAVYEGPDPSWDRWIARDTIVFHTYRMAIYSCRKGR